MVGGEAALEIRVLHRHGKGIREIAREMGSSLTRCGGICVTNGGSVQAASGAGDKARSVQGLCRRTADLGSAGAVPASGLLRELRERGYSGG
jgi:hypothetical protein